MNYNTTANKGQPLKVVNRERAIAREQRRRLTQQLSQVEEGPACRGPSAASSSHQPGTKPALTPRVAMATRGLCRPGLARLGAREACWESTSPPPRRRFELGGPDVGGGVVEGVFPHLRHPGPARLQGQVSALVGFLLRPHGGRPRAQAGDRGGALAISAAELQQFHPVAVVSSPPPELPV